MSLDLWESQLKDWDEAPLAREMHVRQEALALGRKLDRYPLPAGEEARYWRLRSRLACLSDWSHALEPARQSIQWAARLQQWDELEKNLQFLRELESLEAQEAASGADTGPLLEATLRLASCATRAELRSATLELALELTSLSQLSWLDRSEGRWEALAWLPNESWPRYSEQVLNRCRAAGATLFGESTEMGDSRSLLLSDLKMMVAVPILWEQQFFGILYSELEESGLHAGSLRLLEYLAGIVAATAQRLVTEEQARWAFEQAEYLNKLRRKMAAGTTLGLALADRQGRLEQWNAAFAQLWDEPPVAGSLLWEMFSGQEQILDRERSSGVCLAVQRTRSGRRWLQINDWELESEDKRVRCVLDLSAQEPEQWSAFLEEMRHELAADLHDGPAQTAAALQLDERGGAAWALAVRRLQALRSPWLEGNDPEEQLQLWLRSWLPEECALDIGWQSNLATAWTRQCYRLLQTLCEEVAEVWQLRAVRLRVTDEECSLIWLGPSSGRLPGLVREWVEARVTLSETVLKVFVEKDSCGKISVVHHATTE